MIIPIPQFTAPSYGDRTLNEVQECLNLTNILTDGGYKLVSTPGLDLLGTVANNAACRGAHLASGANGTFSVHGNTVYQVDVDGTSTSRGTISTSTGPVYMADNGIHLLIVVPGTNAYTLGISSGSPTLISDSNFPSSPGRCAYLDGYFIVPQIGSAIFYLSQLLDGSDWTPVQFASAEGAPDLLVACVVTGRQLYNIGYRSVEVWYNTGNPDFPLERINGAFHQIGIVGGSSPDGGSIAEFAGTIYFIGSSDDGGGAVWALNSAGMQRISTSQIESMLLESGSGIGWSGIAYAVDGQSFYEISSSTYGKSLLYNITAKSWSRIEVGSACHRINAVSAPNMFTGSGILAFDRANGNVYLYSPLVNDENGTAITRTRTFGPIESETKRVFHSQIRIEAEIKFDTVGTTSISATLDWTDNGGLTYSTAVTMTRTVTSSTTGQRVVWTANRLGSSASRYYRLTLVGPSARIVLKKCELDLKEGRF